MCVGMGRVAYAQGKDPGLTPDEQAGKELSIKLDAAMGPHMTDEDKTNPLGSHPYHIVFLFDSAHVNDTPIYRDFAANVIRYLLGRMQENQKRRGVRADERCLVSVYPYQLDLYTSPDKCLTSVPLSEETVNAAAEKLPHRTIAMRSDGKTPYRLAADGKNPDGSDKTAPRSKLFKLLESDSPDRPPLVIQFTTNDNNAAPNDPKLGPEIGGRDPKTWGVATAGYAPLVTLYRKTRIGLDGHPPVGVHVWAYGPERILPAVRWTEAGDTTPNGSERKDVPPRKRSSLPFVFVGVAVVVGGVVYYLTMSALVTIGGYSKRVRRFPPRTILMVGPGGKETPADAYTVPGVVAAKEGAELATIEFGLLDVEIRGMAWKPQSSGQTSGDTVALERGGKPNDVYLANGSERSQPMRIVVT